MTENEQQTQQKEQEHNDDLYDRLVDEELIKNGGRRYVW